MTYFVEIVIAGAVSGCLYGLVALAFVVVYKATRIVNFALGELVMFAAGFAAVGLHVLGLGLLGALVVGVAGMTCVALAFNYGVLRHLIGRPLIAYVMVTIGFGTVLRALAAFVFAGVPRSIHLPLPEEPVPVLGVLVSPHEVLVGVIALVLILAFSLYFTYSRAGLALRAVSDDETAAMGMGIHLPRYFALTWIMAGAIAVAAGVLWTAFTGGGFNLVLVGLKVLPIVIIGGLESIPGVLVGALLVGILENLTAGYIDPMLGAPLSGTVVYVALATGLLLRPYGIFGQRAIERV